MVCCFLSHGPDTEQVECTQDMHSGHKGYTVAPESSKTLPIEGRSLVKQVNVPPATQNPRHLETRSLSGKTVKGRSLIYDLEKRVKKTLVRWNHLQPYAH